MKLTHLIAAGLMIAGLGVSSTAATAQDYRGDRGYDHRGDRGYDHRGDRGDRNWRNHGRGRGPGWNNHRRCYTEWRHHRRVTVCR